MKCRELEPLGHLLDYPNVATGHAQELDHRQPDRARSDHDRTFPGLRLRPANRVNSNPERFDQRNVLRRQAPASVELLGRKQDPVAHAAVRMHSDHAHFRAAVGPAAPAGGAFPAGEVRVDGATIAGFKISEYDGYYHLDCTLVSKHSLIRTAG